MPRWLGLVLGLAFLAVFTYGIGDFPLKWEEPRRCLIAMEMIESGDYLVPRLHGLPYFNKPPMQNWLIVLLAGNDYARVGPVAVRGVTALSLIGIALLLWRLGTGRGPNLLPVVVLLTFGTIVQHGWAGEIDVLFCFWVTAALAAFEFGRRRGSPVIQWTLSQALLAGGIMTKGLAPLFFYPPVLLLTWRRRDVPFAGLPFVAGLLAMVGLVAAWVVPYSTHGPIADLVATLTAQMSDRTVDQESSSFLLHVMTYPLLVFGVLLPWSFVLLGVPPRRWLVGLRAAWSEPALALALTTVVSGVVAYWFVPGGRGRYLIPLLPWAAMLFARLLESVPRRDATPHGGRPFWIYSSAMAITWIGYVIAVAARDVGGLLLFGLSIVGLAVIGALALARYRGALRSAVAATLMVGLLYGSAYRVVSEEREAQRGRPFVEAGERLTSDLDPALPLMIQWEIDRRTSYALARSSGRTPRSRPPQHQPFAWFAPTEVAGPPGAERLATADRYAVWWVPDADALTRRVVRPDLTPDALLRLVKQRHAARRQYDRYPESLNALLLLARLTAELDDDTTAETLYSRALDRWPEDPRLLRHRGESRLRLGQLADARSDLERAAAQLASTPDAPEIFDGLPDDDPDAISRSPIQRALETTLESTQADQRPDHPTESLRRNVGFHLALAHYLGGAFDAANDIWSAVVTDYPADAESRYWLALTACRRESIPAEPATAADPVAAEYRSAIERLCAGDRVGADDILRGMVDDHAELDSRRWEVLAARRELERLEREPD